MLRDYDLYENEYDEFSDECYDTPEEYDYNTDYLDDYNNYDFDFN
jgi:hypothetical protein